MARIYKSRHNRATDSMNRAKSNMTNIETLLKSLKGSKEGLTLAEILLQHLKFKIIFQYFC